MKIYTRTGDAGETGLFGGGRVPKDDARVRAYGAVDEANAVLGLARAALADDELVAELTRLQSAMFDLGADLATPLDATTRSKIRPIDDDDVAALEATIDRYQAELEPLRHFVLPAGAAGSAALQLARAVVRRAERDTVALAHVSGTNGSALRFLNRLSDLLFVMARVANARAGVPDVPWVARPPSAD